MGATRRGPRHLTKKQLLAEFGYCCAYCDYPFGTLLGNGRGVTTVQWDHLVPYSWLLANPEHNFVPACRLCNSIKSATLFHSLGEARAYVLEGWELRSQPVLWVPSISNLQDPKRWATEYASYLCGRYEKSDSTDPTAHRYRPSAYLTPMPETYPTYPEPLIASETDDENLESPDKDESSESLYGAIVDVLEGTESL